MSRKQVCPTDARAKDLIDCKSESRMGKQIFPLILEQGKCDLISLANGGGVRKEGQRRDSEPDRRSANELYLVWTYVICLIVKNKPNRCVDRPDTVLVDLA